MSAALRQTAENFSARYRKVAPGLPGPPEARRRAAAWFDRHGLPDTREEDWRFTSLRPLAGMVFSEPADEGDSVAGLLDRLPAIEAPALVFANGRLRSDLSRFPSGAQVGGAQAGMRIASFADQPSFGSVNEGGALSALNTMFAEDGARIEIERGRDAGSLVLVHLASGSEGHAPQLHPRHQVRIAAGARLTLIEIALGQGAYLHNPLTEVILEEGSRLCHIRLQDESLTAFHLASLSIRLGAKSSYEGALLVRGGRVARTELHAAIEGEGAQFALHAAQILKGEQLADITTYVKHLAPGAASRQTVRNVLTGRAHGVFQGRIAVDRVAQKTDGYQMNKTLLLSDEAQINTKPELEIFADDVKCSHGATVGALDSDQLFYLQSRGVPKEEARAMLVGAFLAEMLETIPDEWGRRLFEGAVHSWWTDSAR